MFRQDYRWLATVLLVGAVGTGCASKPHAVPAVAPAQLQQQLAEADQQLANNRLAEAAARYERIVQADPANASAWYRLGTVYLRTDKPALAQHAFSQALQANPQLTKAYSNIALAHLLQFRSAARLALASDQVPEANRAALKALLTDVEIGLAPSSDRAATGVQPSAQPASPGPAPLSSPSVGMRTPRRK